MLLYKFQFYFQPFSAIAFLNSKSIETLTIFTLSQFVQCVQLQFDPWPITVNRKIARSAMKIDKESYFQIIHTLPYLLISATDSQCHQLVDNVEFRV